MSSTLKQERTWMDVAVPHPVCVCARMRACKCVYAYVCCVFYLPFFFKEGINHCKFFFKYFYSSLRNQTDIYDKYISRVKNQNKQIQHLANFETPF